MLARQMFQKDAAGVLGKTLGCIAAYCRDNNLPPLNCIVVAKGQGRPGDKIPETSDELREQVYALDWYDIFPPTPDDLLDAYNSA